jgi:hypothetical protein
MSSCDTSIEITGSIDDAVVLDKLVAAIVRDQPTGDWSGEAIRTEAAALQHIRDALDEGGNLAFAENERSGDSFPEIEEVCRQSGLAYVLTVSVDEEFDTPGSREIYDPAKRTVEKLSGVDPGTVDAAEFRQDRRGQGHARLRHRPCGRVADAFFGRRGAAGRAGDEAVKANPDLRG